MLLEADDPQAKAGRLQVDMTTVAVQLQDAINQREINKLDKMNAPAQNMTRTPGPRKSAVDSLRTGKAMVAKVMPGKSEKGMYSLMVMASGRDVSLVRNRSSRNAVTDSSKTHFLFETEDEMKAFIGKVVGHMGLTVVGVSIEAMSDDDSGTTTYGYAVQLKPA